MTDSTPTPITVPDEIKNAIDADAVIVLSMSGGKDSQATASAVLRYIEENQLTNRVVAVHADLGRAEWFDTDETLRRQVEEFGLELTVVQRTKGDLLQRIQERAEKLADQDVPFWPSSKERYCTSDLKRNPIDKFLRRLGSLVISVEGLRADESAARSRKPCWEARTQLDEKKIMVGEDVGEIRTALTWRPIHFWTTEDVWTELGTSAEELERRQADFAAGNEADAFAGWPAHNAYVRGNERLSCSLCILGKLSDLENGARHNPEYFAELCALEEEYGYTFKADFSLVELAKRLKEEDKAAAHAAAAHASADDEEDTYKAAYIAERARLGSPVEGLEDSDRNDDDDDPDDDPKGTPDQVEIDFGTTPPLMVAYGMGVDSTAVLVGLEQRGIRPDAILFADVGAEKPETYAYLDTMNEWLARVGFPEITVVRYVPKSFKHTPYSTLEGNCISNGTLPSLAFGRKSCSLKWKVAPQNEWTERWTPALEAWDNGLKVRKAIGYDASAKDTKRCTYAAAKYGDDPKYDNWYPLQEWGWEREECQRQIAAAGLPVPMKSACFFCPASKPAEIAWLVDNHPELADRIVEMERVAEPKLHTIEGLWRRAVKGVRGGTKKPGSMTEYIRHYRSTGRVEYDFPNPLEELHGPKRSRIELPVLQDVGVAA